jgi:hypothetical protein
MKEVSVSNSVRRSEQHAFKSVMTRKMRLLITKVYALHPEANYHLWNRHQHLQFTPEIIQRSFSTEYVTAGTDKLSFGLGQWFPNCGGRPPGGGARDPQGGGARGAKLFYSLKINKKQV